MKLNIMKAGVVLMSVAGAACTGNYLDINKNPYEVSKDQTLTDGYAIAAAMNALCGTVVSTDVNTAQFTDCLLGGPAGGYYATSNSAFASTIDNYNPTDDWTRVFMASDKIIPTLYSNMVELKGITDDPIITAIANVIRVCAMNRVTDTYGPIPYSQIGVGGKIQVAYDSQEQVYDKMFEELNQAIDILTQNRAGAIAAQVDPIYGGKVENWCKLANSMKLRLAMRIVYANPTKAREMAESAVKHEVGVFSSNADNAKLPSSAFGDKGNSLYTAIKYNEIKPSNGVPGSNTGGDTHVAADITCYMNGYEDPRREHYFIESEWGGETNKYIGLRRGIEIPSLATIGRKYSGVKITNTSSIDWMNAAEVAFLKAEAKAVFAFDMGGEASSFYYEGIRLSFEQWGASGYEDYIAVNAEKKPKVYTDPASLNSYAQVLSELIVAWEPGATPAQMQERIIIQKWIANFNIGNEAWADYRRTGYPHFIPATDAGNKSNGVVNSKLGARRMPYPQAEYTNNPENIQQAVATHLKGSDNMATRVWWDCNPAIN